MRSSRVVAAVGVGVATAVDLLAYSVAVPVLPDLATRLGASPTTIGLIFGSFGITLLAISIPMGAISDRIGRKAPMVAGLVMLAVSTVLFAMATNIPSLFAARLVQGAADGITWVVGFALIADLFGPAERGRIVGYVMSGTNFGLLAGPTLGGWLYEMGGIALPFTVVAAISAATAGLFMALRLPPPTNTESGPPVAAVLRVPAVRMCVLAAVAGSATITMFEPVLPLVLDSRMGLGPAAVGVLFGVGALASATVHPLYGHLSDRHGGRGLTVLGLCLSACLIPVLTIPTTPLAMGIVMVLLWASLSMTVTPSLAYAATAVSAAGVESFGVVYGAYNVAWGVGLLGGPALGGFLLERVGFEALTVIWAPFLLLVALFMWRTR
jgi:multidrug resistance protein